MKMVALKNLAEVSAGYPLRGAVDSLPAGDTAVIQMRNADSELGVNWDEAARIELPSKREPSLLQAGDVIFTARGTRNQAIVLEHVPCAAVCSPHFFIIRVKHPDMVSPAFLAWQMNQRPTQEYFQREATGSYILNIRRDVIEQLLLALPSIAQQKAIVDFDTTARQERKTLTNLIENRTQQMEAIAYSLLSHLERSPA